MYIYILHMIIIIIVYVYTYDITNNSKDSISDIPSQPRKPLSRGRGRHFQGLGRCLGPKPSRGYRGHPGLLGSLGASAEERGLAMGSHPKIKVCP